MERYNEYKDSGVQWLGEIPRHWEMLSGRVLFKENKSKNDGGNRNVLSLSYGKIIIKKDTNEGLVPAEYSHYQIIKPGYIIVRCTDLQNDKVSLRTAVSDLEGIITGAYLGIIPYNTVNSHFLHYLLRAWDNCKELYRYGSGLRQSLSWVDFKYLQLPVPSIEEQNAMVAYLDTATAKIDEAIAQQQKMIDLLNERKQIIINNAVTKGLNPDAPMKDSGVDWIGEIPEHWEVMPLKRCCELVREKCSKAASFRVALENIESWSGTYLDTTSEYDGIGVRFKEGDILFGKLRPYLAKVYLAEKDGEALGDIWILRSKSSCFSGYIHKILLSKKIIDVIDSSTYGTKMPRADWGTNSKLCIPVPPFSEQETITSFLDTISFNIECAISNATKQISLLQERKQIIINDVVTGKVKVTK